MKLISLEEVEISPHRQRREFEESSLNDLAESILDKGLLHPIVLRSDGQTLVAGERRIRAINLLSSRGETISHCGETLPPFSAPFVTLGDLTPYQVEEAELEENLKREDLTWQEEAAALARLHEMKQKQAEERGDDKPWTATDTITELLGSAPSSKLTKLRESQILAEELSDPEVAKAKTAKEAMKIIERKRKSEHREKLARELSLRPTKHRIINGDCLDHLKSLPPDSVDIILTDPPYGIGADSFGDQSVNPHIYDDSESTFLRLVPEALRLSSRLAKRDSACYIFCDIRNWPQIITWLSELNWRVFQTPIIWDKGNVGILPWPDAGPRRCYEAIAYAVRGDMKVNKISSDIISSPGESRPEFAAEKPVDILSELLSRSAKPGDTVLDPFAGAGGIIPASNRHQCEAIAIELSEDKYNHILTRIEEE